MRRAVLVALTVGSAILLPWAFWDGPPPAPTPPAEPGLPDRVFVAAQRDQLPFGQPGTRTCDCNLAKTALLIQDDALWLGDTARFPSPVHILRDGSEWAAVEEILRALAPDREHGYLEVAVHDDARYEDLLTAMVVTKSIGFSPRVIQPALPAYPNHGWQGGMEF